MQTENDCLKSFHMIQTIWMSITRNINSKNIYTVYQAQMLLHWTEPNLNVNICHVQYTKKRQRVTYLICNIWNVSYSGDKSKHKCYKDKCFQFILHQVIIILCKLCVLSVWHLFSTKSEQYLVYSWPYC